MNNLSPGNWTVDKEDDDIYWIRGPSFHVDGSIHHGPDAYCLAASKQMLMALKAVVAAQSTGSLEFKNQCVEYAANVIADMERKQNEQ